MKTIILSTFLAITSLIAFSQEKGFVRGNIVDGDFGGPMISATITVAELPGVGTTTDFDGNFSLALDPGTYTIEVSFVSYTKKVFPNTAVKAGGVTIIDAVMTSSIEQLQAVEIVAEARRNTESVMLMDMKNSTNVQDGLSAQSFRKVGDSDLSGAMKRITGVTVQNGKYVYVRGLGDRYTKTTLNGMAIPGLDPDVNAVQIDIFPTSVLENVAVFKTFSPDLDGDFTGGLINVVTKKFPEEKTTQVSAGLSYVAGQTFNSDYLTYNAGSFDWMGFDDGTRALPFPTSTKIPNEVLIDPKLAEYTQAFNPTMAAVTKTAMPNGSFSFNHGNQKNRDNESTIGYNIVLNYSNQTSFYKGFQSNDYLKDNDKTENELFLNIERIGDLGKNSVVWSSLFSGSYKKKNSSYSAMLLTSQSGESSATVRYNNDYNQNQATLYEHVLTYTQRSLNTFILNGTHKTGLLEITWGNALSRSSVDDPDFRETRINITDGDTSLATGTGAGVDRFWRNLIEYTESFKGDVKIKLGDKLEIKTGLIGTFKIRDFDVQSYKLRRTNLNDVSIDPDWYLQDENIWSANVDEANYRNGTYVLGNYQKANTFTAKQYVAGSYILLQQTIKKKLKLVYGVRAEKTGMFYTGENNSGTRVYRNENTFDKFNVLPSLNAVFSANDKTNFRIGANRTVARPSFKEKSIAQIYDPVTKRTFNGNIDLDQTTINNFDLRYEYFISPKELLAVAAFYKQFDGHIELVSFATAPNNFKPRNSGFAQVYGIEVEIRKSLEKITKLTFLNRFFITANTSFVQSKVDLTTVKVDNTGGNEFDLRENNARDGETINKYRPMSGQSPYSVNAAIVYEIPESGTNISLAYNVQGEQLSIIASGRVPDIYTIPFNSLNFNAYRNFGKNKKARVTLSVMNILNDDVTLVYRSYKAADTIYTSYKPGISAGLKYTYTF